LQASLACRGLLTVLLIVLNSYALGMYVRGMRESGSLVATVLNTAISFLCSAVFGFVLFGEHLPPLWWAGAASIVAGVVLLATSASSSTRTSTSSTSHDEAARVSGRTRSAKAKGSGGARKARR
jgi:drug/metabolite transporter (DMT)-like permease